MKRLALPRLRHRCGAASDTLLHASTSSRAPQPQQQLRRATSGSTTPHPRGWGGAQLGALPLHRSAAPLRARSGSARHTAPLATAGQVRSVSVRTRHYTDEGSDADRAEGPLAVYKSLQRKGLIVDDPHQRDLLDRLQELWTALAVQGGAGGCAQGVATPAPTPEGAAPGGSGEAAPPASRHATIFGSFNRIAESIRTLGQGADGGGSSTSALRALVAPGGGGGGAEFIDKSERFTASAGYAGHRGVYIHGDVGCGKTMIMDIFYSCLPTSRKLRIHLDAFMSQTYKTVHQLSNWRAAGILREQLELDSLRQARAAADTNRGDSGDPSSAREAAAQALIPSSTGGGGAANGGGADASASASSSCREEKGEGSGGGGASGSTPEERRACSELEDLESLSVMDIYVEKLCDAYDVICFDEFQVLDPADASMLTRLFSLLFKRGVLLVCTSNKETSFFTTLGRQYRPFVGLLQESCDSFFLASGHDYRRLSGIHVPTMCIQPNTEENLGHTLRLFQAAAVQEVERGYCMANQGRTLRVPYRAGGLCMWTFEDICGNDHPLSPSDFNALANAFHTVFVVNVPILGIVKRNEARRFVTLIDELYQFKVNVVLCAEAPADRLFNYKTLRDASQSAFAHQQDAAESSSNTHWREDDSEQLMWRFTGEEDVFSFKRAESRLAEMATREYILLPHLNFVVDDLNVEVLLGGSLEASERPAAPGLIDI